MPITTQQQAEALANLLHTIRPDWDTPGIIHTLHQNRTHPAPYHTIATTAVKQATNPNTRTPVAIFLNGPHWPPTTQTQLPPNPCPDHPEEHATNCRACTADHKTGIRPKTHIGKHYEPPMT